MIFLTFSNSGFMSTSRIANQAKEFELFDEIVELTEKDIPEYIAKHKQFINDNPSGYGRWIWKPKIIHDTLLKMKENDILFYSDAGTYLNVHGKNRFIEYIELLGKNENNLITFSTNGYYAKEYVKIDAILHCYKDKMDEFFNDNSFACYAGIMIIKKTDKSVSLIKEWLELCENYHFLDSSPSHINEKRFFSGNDSDSGLFNLCLIKHKIHHSIYPDETNIYINNKQIHHTTNNIPVTTWDQIKDKPIQVRRITPKFINEYNKYNN